MLGDSQSGRANLNPTAHHLRVRSAVRMIMCMRITSSIINGRNETITHTRDVAITEDGTPWTDARIAALNLNAYAVDHDGDFHAELAAALGRCGYKLVSFYSLGPSHVEAEVAPAAS